jgi:class 3 adenylate cyclase
MSSRCWQRLEQTRARLDDLLHRFVPEQVADAMLESSGQVRLGGVRRQITVLFADLRGFSAWAAAQEPEVVLATLNCVFESTLEALLSHGATLDKFVGDAIMAFFNAPGDQPDHVARALACARQIRDLQGLGAGLRFGIGMNSGMAIAGNVGASRAMQYTVLGDVVNVAKRLEELAGPGEVLLGPGLVRLAGPGCDCRAFRQVALRGRPGKLKIYRLEN